MKRLRGLRDLIFDTVEATTHLVEQTHAETLRRSVDRLAPIEPLRPPARAIASTHGQIAGGVYATVRAVNRAVCTITQIGTDAILDGVAHLDAPTSGEPSTPLRSDAAGTLGWLLDHAETTLNGFAGSHLARRNNALDLGMSFRHHGRVVDVERDALGARFPNATRRVVVFLHGLSCTEWSFSLFADRYYGDPTINFGSLLEAEHGYTPFYVRYNSGCHVSENGKLLSQLLDRLVSQYPGPIDEIALIGHSMGGLVARSAAHYAREQKTSWVERLRHVFCLGSPHLGAPLEKATNLLSGVLRSFDTAGTTVPARILDFRSDGIKDLRFGYTLDDEWQGKDPDAILEDHRADVPFVDGVGYYFIAATLARDPASPAGHLLGDLLVRLPSAAGYAPEPARRIRFHGGRVLTGMHHFHLANHPDVYAVITQCLEASPRPPRLAELGESGASVRKH